MLNIKNVSFSYSSEPILNSIDFSVFRGDKIGLVGKNGSGKTTLLKIINGTITTFNGTISTEGSISISYLSQEIDFEILDDSAFSLAKKAFSQFDAMTEELHRCSEDLLNQKKAERYNEILQYLMKHDGLNYEYKIKHTLHSLGFADHEFEKSLKNMSGGYKVRAYLAYLILKKPDVLMLDEPTNYLDIDAVQFLIKFLNDYENAFIIISHDKYLMDSVINKVLHLSNTVIKVYSNANYTEFIKRKNEYLNQLIKQKANQDRKIEEMDKFIEKFRYKASKASLVQSRIKMRDRLEQIDISIEKTLHFYFKTSGRTYSNILSCEKLSFNYSDKEILHDAYFSILRGDKLFLIGKNGIGKTTFLKLLCNILNPVTGQVKIHNNAKIAYFAQNLTESLDVSITVMEEFMKQKAVQTMNDNEKRSYLGLFGFSSTDIEKKVAVLSGGEKVRLILASISVSQPDIFILDEPTTHLDIETKEILLHGLQNFDGALLIVSHDIDFTKNLAQKFITIVDGELVTIDSIEQYFDKYSNTEKKKKIEKLDDSEKSIKFDLNEGLINNENKQLNEKNSRDKNAKEKSVKPINLSKNSILQMEKEADLLIQQIELCEYRMDEIGKEMNTGDYGKIQELHKEFDELKSKHGAMYERLTNIDKVISQIK